MEKIKGYEKAEKFTDIEKLPAGGYVIGILGVEEVAQDWGDVLEIKFDIAEGNFSNYYSKQYMSGGVSVQTEDKKYKGVYRLNIPTDGTDDKNILTMRIFKTAISAIEESNTGYHWDWNEKSLVGKKVGCIFWEKEYSFNGKQGFFVAPHSLRNIADIREGKFKIPAPKLLKTDNKQKAKQEDLPPFMRDDDALPFDA